MQRKAMCRKKLFGLIVAAAALTAARLQAQMAVPPDFALPVSAADSSKPGFLWNVSEVLASEPNRLSWAESQIADLQGQNFANTSVTGDGASGPATVGKDPN